MSDALASSRLPDLPNAGYATRTQRELSDAVMFLIRNFERDRLLLIETVLQGAGLWRKRFTSAYKAIKADGELADSVFRYFVLLAGPNPGAQKAILEGMERQQQTESWDRRVRTKLRHAKDRRQLDRDIRREMTSVKRKATWHSG